MKNKRLVIHICSKDRATEVALLLQSLRTQTFTDWNLLILDDASRVPLQQFYFINYLIQRLKLEGHDVKILRNEISAGVSMARQTLVDYTMKNRKFKSSIVFGLVILFIGASIIQISGSNIIRNYEIYNGNQNIIDYIPGEFIVKFKSDINIEFTRGSNGFICMGIPSIDILNEKYGVIKIDELFNTRANPYLYNIFKFALP